MKSVAKTDKYQGRGPRQYDKDERWGRNSELFTGGHWESIADFSCIHPLRLSALARGIISRQGAKEKKGSHSIANRYKFGRLKLESENKAGAPVINRRPSC